MCVPQPALLDLPRSLHVTALTQNGCATSTRVTVHHKPHHHPGSNRTELVYHVDSNAGCGTDCGAHFRQPPPTQPGTSGPPGPERLRTSHTVQHQSILSSSITSFSALPPILSSRLYLGRRPSVLVHLQNGSRLSRRTGLTATRPFPFLLDLSRHGGDCTSRYGIPRTTLHTG
jgi:hypothetical protein